MNSAEVQVDGIGLTLAWSIPRSHALRGNAYKGHHAFVYSKASTLSVIAAPRCTRLAMTC